MAWVGVGVTTGVGLVIGARGVSVGASMTCRIAVAGIGFKLFVRAFHRKAIRIPNTITANRIAMTIILRLSKPRSILNIFYLDRH
jgi:hypothetical protein